MQIWYLSPFLLALLVWWVATRKHPEDKEKWTWLALGVCAGAVLMFTLVFLSERKVAEATNLAYESLRAPDSERQTRLEGDNAVEVLPPVRIRQNRSTVVGSLQITLMEVTKSTARLQIEPRVEIERIGVGQWFYQSDAESADGSGRRTYGEVALGDFLEFGFRGRLYRLGLLEIQLPLWGFAPEETQSVLPSNAVIRLVEAGFYSTISGEPITTTPSAPLHGGEGTANDGNMKSRNEGPGAVPPSAR